MAPAISSERQKLLLQQEIAKLSGAISRHAAGPSRPSPYHPYPHGRPAVRGQGVSRGQGPGRGSRTYGLDLRAANKASPAGGLEPSRGAATPVQSVAAEEKEAGEVSPSPPDTDSTDKDKEVETSWVKKTSKGGNMSLMTVEKRNVLQSRPLPPRRPRRPKVPPQVQVLNSTTTTTPGGGEGKRVVIDGVIFQFEQGGKKLTRIGELSSIAGPSGPADTKFSTPTRRSLDYGGNKYRRTNRGNLVSSARGAELAKKPCRYYTKTGRCHRALTCPYEHVPDRLAICPRFLRSTCPNESSTCPLSHSPSAHNTPSCVHFQSASSCRNGCTCLYPHVRVSDDAPVCEAFAREGWCERAEGTCPEMHVWECGEWRAKGSCSRGGRCGLRHVIRAEDGKRSVKEAEAVGMAGDQELWQRNVPVEGGFEDGAEFIELGEGLRGLLSSEETEEDGGESESDSSEEDDSEGEGNNEVDDGSHDDGQRTGKQGVSPSPLRRSSASLIHDVKMDTDEEDEDAVLGVVS